MIVEGDEIEVEIKPYCEIVAEIGANHCGDLDLTLGLIRSAKRAGADAVKIQTWTPGLMTPPMPPGSDYRIADGPWSGKLLSKLYEEAHLPWSWYGELFACAKELEIEIFSSVFDLEALAFLESIGCPRYKIASAEIRDLELIQACAKTAKPLILSTGMATSTDIRHAMDAARWSDFRDITLLKCVSGYPAPASEMNLRQIAALRGTYDQECKIGLSDHSRNAVVAIAAVALGIEMLEVHFMAERTKTLDAGFSWTEAGLASLVRDIRETEKALGDGHEFKPAPSERPHLGLRRSLYYARDLPAGAVIQNSDLVTHRPNLGMDPRFRLGVVGKKLKDPVQLGMPVIGTIFE